MISRGDFTPPEGTTVRSDMPTPEVEAPGPHTRIDPALERRLAIIGQAIRWLAVLYSVIVLGDTIFDWFGQTLPEGPPTVRSIAPSEAVSLVVLALGAMLGGDNQRTAGEPVAPRRIGLILSWAAAGFGLFLMLTFIFNLMWPWWEDVSEMPAFTVGVNLLALGVAVPLSVNRLETRVIAGQVSSLLVFSLTAVIFLGYAYGEPSVGRLFLRPEISFQAAVGALLIALGVILIRPGSGLLSIAASPSTGGKLIRWLGPAVLLAPALLLFMVETLPTNDRIDALAFVAVTLGFLLLILLGILARVVDVTAIEASTAQAHASRAQLGLDQEAPLVATLAERFHIVETGDVEGWEVATRFRPGDGAVIGDSSAVSTIPGGRIGIVLVDVTGHGVPPALRSIRVRDLLLHSLALGESPAAALGKIDWTVGNEMLATAVVLCLEPVEGKMTLASAGHPPVIRVGSQSVDLYQPTGPLLFLSSEARYEDVDVDLALGDEIVIFSDGVADVQTTSNGRTQPEQLADILLAEGGSAPRTADLVLGFGENDPSDDQTVVVVRRVS